MLAALAGLATMPALAEVGPAGSGEAPVRAEMELPGTRPGEAPVTPFAAVFLSGAREALLVQIRVEWFQKAFDLMRKPGGPAPPMPPDAEEGPAWTLVSLAVHADRRRATLEDGWGRLVLVAPGDRLDDGSVVRGIDTGGVLLDTAHGRQRLAAPPEPRP